MNSRVVLATGLTSVLVGGITLAAVAKPDPAPAAGVPKAGAASALSGPEGEKFFAEQVRPLLEQKCVSCHSGEKPQGDLRLTTRAALLKGGVSGPAAIAGQPGKSLLISAINFQGRRMPPQGQMAPKDIATLTRWVALGMPWPAGEHASLEPKAEHGPPQVNEKTKQFWSFQPVRRPAVPAVKMKAWVRNPIDAFVLKRLESEGLKPNPTASRATLIRRAYYDMLGLPPTPEEVQAFLNDKSPNAWEKVVDRLLASPQYGEKWGRHWLDLVRFAESNSYERDGTKPNAWRYRDYVIRSFNEDKPYDQFVTEQLAGDELSPRTPERLIATGYYRLGIWDDEPADPLLALYDDLDDIANTTGQTFLGMTIGCARCHDHKIDPMPQKDYYRFLAFFSGVRRYGVRSHESVEAASLRSIATEEEKRMHRERVAPLLAENARKIQAVEDRLLPDLTPVEKEEWRNPFARFDIAAKRVPKLLSRRDLGDYRRLLEERRRLQRSEMTDLPMALCVTEERQPRETFVLLRGNPHAKGDPVEPGFLSVLTPPQPRVVPAAHGDTSGRRLALAQWIASRENPLTSRVMVNRVWHYHFGRGLVKSTSNFGFQGDKPTHPELLDWLADRFSSPATVSVASNRAGQGKGQLTIDNSQLSIVNSRSGAEFKTGFGWRLKPLHRLILLSNTYKMSSQAQPAALKKDPENDLLWRFDMRRLQAEEVRDAILAVNGSLNPKMWGPSFYPDIPADVLAGQSRPGENWGKSSPEEQRRRSVYIFVKRSLMTPIIASFDGPETDFTCPNRFSTTQPTQALGMLNSEWTNEQAHVLAEYLRKHAGDDTAAQVKLALWRVTQREPTPKEIERGVNLIRDLQKEDGKKPEEALQAFCVVALNLNEFLYLD